MGDTANRVLLIAALIGTLSSSASASQQSDLALRKKAFTECESKCHAAEKLYRSHQDPCAGVDLSPYHCGGTSLIDPYAVARAPASTDAVCRHYLLLSATDEFRHARSRASKALPWVDSLNGTFDTFSQLYCGAVGSVSEAAEAVVTGSIPVVTDAKIEHEYCAFMTVAASRCESEGGKQITVSPPPGTQGSPIAACSFGGVILDPSCLAMDDSKLRMVKQAIEDLRGRGVSCLGSKGRNLNPTIAAALDKHLSATSPRSQICCGAKCQSPAPWLPRPGFPKVSIADSNNASFGTGRAAYLAGTVKLNTDRLKDQEELSRTLFHEMLHQIGLADSKDHDTYGDFGAGLDRWMKSAADDGSCPSGFITVKFSDSGEAQSYFSAKITSHELADDAGDGVHGSRRDLEDFNQRALSEAKAGLPVCVRSNACGQPLPPLSGYQPFRETFLASFDPVYACTTACFEPKLLDDSSTVSAATRASVMAQCRSPKPATGKDIVERPNIQTACVSDPGLTPVGP